MWPLFQPIRTLEILKLCEISWDLLKKYFHLKSNAVYNSSAKKCKKLTVYHFILFLRHELRHVNRSLTPAKWISEEIKYLSIFILRKKEASNSWGFLLFIWSEWNGFSNTYSHSLVRLTHSDALSLKSIID